MLLCKANKASKEDLHYKCNKHARGDQDSQKQSYGRFDKSQK